MLIVLMGVSGSGKTTIGQLLSTSLHIPFFDADDFHPLNNRDKMSQGIPLTDADRFPWLDTLAELLKTHENEEGAILACSALKDIYRAALQKSVQKKIHWVHLEGSQELIIERLKTRSGHFMPASLLESQFQILEKPDGALSISVQNTPEQIIEAILNHMNNTSPHPIGLIGLGVMGSNLALNLRDKGIDVAAYNRQSATEVDVAKKFSVAHGLKGYDDLPTFVNSISIPRKILLMVNAGSAVDDVIHQLIPLLQPGDLIIDGGNSHYEDTQRRSTVLKQHGLLFAGVGISGGEEGARNGPAIMPGGSPEAYMLLAPILNLIAAKDLNENPCSTYIGPEGAGHFVKMVHNGIEYAEMQILAETYAIMKGLFKLSPEQMSATLDQWRQEGEGSYLLEITRDIFLKKENEAYLLDKILDAAEQKGTGAWTLKSALDLGIPVNTITEAVIARTLSSMKDFRVIAHQSYASIYRINKTHQFDLKDLKAAYTSTRLINHVIGFEMLRHASNTYLWDLNLSEIARIWTNGCIIRSVLMEKISEWMRSDSNLLTHETVVQLITSNFPNLSKVVGESLQNSISLPVYSAALNYVLSITTDLSPANLIQAQRDFFGAHKYKRIDSDQKTYFHTDW